MNSEQVLGIELGKLAGSAKLRDWLARRRWNPHSFVPRNRALINAKNFQSIRFLKSYG